MAAVDSEAFAEAKQRLDEIVDAVSDDNLPLDDAISLYEEAVSVCMKLSDLIEEDIKVTSDEGALDETTSGANMGNGAAGEGWHGQNDQTPASNDLGAADGAASVSNEQ